MRCDQPASRWALLADTHVSADLQAEYHGYRPADSNRDAVTQVRAVGPDGVLINGDIAWMEGLAGDYAAAEQLLGPLAETRPLITTPGNHDQRSRLCAAFSEPPMDDGADKVATVADAGHVRIAALDSLRRTDIVSGQLGREQLNWLDGWLGANRDKPAALFVHHPLDDPRNGLLDSDRLLALLADQPQVKAVFTAHDHVFGRRKQNEMWIVTQPAVGFPFGGAKMQGWLEVEFNSDGMTVQPRPRKGPVPPAIRLEWLR